MKNYYNFDYNGYKFRMTDWHTDDFSDHEKGIVQIYIEDIEEWFNIVAYESDWHTKTLEIVTNKRTEIYHDKDNFIFDENSVTDFIERNVISIDYWLQYEIKVGEL